VYDEPAPSATPHAVTWSALLTQTGLPAARSTPESRRSAQQGTVRSDGAVAKRQFCRFRRFGRAGPQRPCRRSARRGEAGGPHPL